MPSNMTNKATRRQPSRLGQLSASVERDEDEDAMAGSMTTGAMLDYTEQRPNLSGMVSGGEQTDRERPASGTDHTRLCYRR